MLPYFCDRRALAMGSDLGGVENGICSLFADHIDRAYDEKAGNPGKDGSVGNAQAGGSVHPKITGKDSTGISRSDGARAGRVMTPCMLANELPQLFIVLQFDSGNLLGKNEIRALQSVRHAPDVANTFDYGGEIVAVLIVPFVKMVKINPRTLPRIAPLKRDRSAAVIGVRFQQRKREVVTTLADFVRVAGKISREARQYRHNKQIWICPARA